jgi:hypothetical protein
LGLFEMMFEDLESDEEDKKSAERGLPFTLVAVFSRNFTPFLLSPVRSSVTPLLLRDAFVKYFLLRRTSPYFLALDRNDDLNPSLVSEDFSNL